MIKNRYVVPVVIFLLFAACLGYAGYRLFFTPEFASIHATFTDGALTVSTQPTDLLSGAHLNSRTAINLIVKNNSAATCPVSLTADQINEHTQLETQKEYGSMLSKGKTYQLNVCGVQKQLILPQ